MSIYLNTTIFQAPLASGRSGAHRLTRDRGGLLFAAGCMVLAMLSAAFAEAQSSFSTANEYYEDATRRISSGDDSGALIQLRNALQLNNSHAPSMLTLGQTLLKTGDASEAVLVLNDALLLGADPLQVIPPLIDAYLGSGAAPELLSSLEPSQVPRSLRAEVYAARAQALLVLGRSSDARTMIAEARALDASNFRASLAEVTFYLQRAEPENGLTVSSGLVTQAPDDTRSWNTHGSVLHALGRLDEAVVAYTRAIDTNARNVDARIALIDLLMETGREQRAEPHISYLRETYPTEPRAVFYSGLLAARSGDATKEQLELTLAASLFGAVKKDQITSNPQFLMLAALSNYGIGAHKSADAYIDNYLSLRGGDAGALRLKASNLLAMGDASGAVRALTNLNERNPADPVTASLLAAAHSQLGNHELAARLLASSVDVTANAALEQQLAFSRLNAGAFEEGITALERIRANNPDRPGIDLQLVVAYLRADRPDAAIAILDQLSNESPAAPAVLNLRAVALSNQGDRAAAEATWNQLLGSDDTSLAALVNLALLQLQSGQLDEALALATRAQTAHPDAAQPLIIEARTRMGMNQPEESMRAAEQALALAPDNDDAAWLLVQAMLALGKPEEAKEAARRYANAHSSSLAASAMLGRTYELVDEAPRARIIYTQMSRRPDLSADDLYRIARLQRNATALDSAALSLVFALQRDPQHTLARLELASVELQLEKFSQAEETAMAQLGLTPENASAWLYVGEARMGKDEPASAESAFGKAIELGAGAWGYIGQYRALRTQGKLRAAEASLRAGLAASDNDLRLQAALADLLITEARWVDAERALTEILASAPNSPQHLNNRAYVRQQLRQLETAEADARAALAVNPEYGAAYDTLGWILVDADRAAEALPLLREATARMGSDVTVRFHLARVLADLGRSREALAELYHLLESDADFPERAQAQTLQARLQ